MINLWMDSRIYQSQRILVWARQRNYLEPSKEKVLGEYDAGNFTMLYLKALHDMASQNSSINFSDAAIMS